MKSIVFDLDDTICFPNHEYSDTHNKYALAEPNEPIIVKMRELRLLGFHIHINSARRMVTHGGDLDKILSDVQEVTIKWLWENGVPYDELSFGKPYSSTFYVDDKSMNLEEFLRKDFNEGQ